MQNFYRSSLPAVTLTSMVLAVVVFINEGTGQAFTIACVVSAVGLAAWFGMRFFERRGSS